VKQWITLAKPLFPHAKFLGAEITGHASLGDPYIYEVAKVDGKLIDGIGIQLYPQFGYSTVSGFLRSLTVANSVGLGVPAAAALMKTACPTCTIPILLNEFQGGSGENPKYVPFREGYPDVPFFVASIIQGFDVHLAQFMPWTLAGTPTGLTTHPGSCDMGLIELNTKCTGATLTPTYYLYSNLLSKFPYGKLTEVAYSDHSAVYAVQVTNGTHTVVLVANANPATTEDLKLGSGFPTKGTLTSYLMDFQHVAVPLTSTVTLKVGTSTKVDIPPLGVMLLSFSPTGGTESPPSGLTAAPMPSNAAGSGGLTAALVPSSAPASGVNGGVIAETLLLSVAALGPGVALTLFVLLPRRARTRR
jgi:hypothetical protein